jgi:hypothetical protein
MATLLRLYPCDNKLFIRFVLHGEIFCFEGASLRSRQICLIETKFTFTADHT